MQLEYARAVSEGHVRRRTLCFGLVVASCACAVADPVVMEESARILSPQSDREIIWRASWDSAQYSSRVAVSGNTALVIGMKDDPDGSSLLHTPWVFERSSTGQWQHTATLQPARDSVQLYFGVPIAAAIDGDLAVAGSVFQRGASGWARVAALHLGPDVEISSGRIADSTDNNGGHWSADVLARNASNQWAVEQTLTVNEVPRWQDGEYHGGDVDLSGNQLIINAPFGESWDDTPIVPQAQVFERGANGWTLRGHLQVSGSAVAIENGTALVGSRVFTRNASGVWGSHSEFHSSDEYMRGSHYVLELENGLIVGGYPDDGLRGTNAGSLRVWQRNSAGVFEELARLVASDAAGGAFLGYDVDVDGRRIIAAAEGAAYVFELPTNLVRREPIQDDFEDGEASGWAPLSGSAFGVVAANGSRVYRQSSLNGDAGAVFGTTEWDNQAIQVDVRPTQFSTSGSDRWFGVAVRRRDSANYYYVTARRSNTLQLKKMVNGVFTTLASVPLSVALNRTYRLRLEAIGSRLRVHLDGRLVLEATDKSLKRGLAGLQLFRTAADFDNIVISPNPQASLYATNFEGFNPDERFTKTGDGAWELAQDGTQVLRQTNRTTPTGGRAIAGVATDDQVVQVRVKADAFDTTGNPWFGLITRYRDDRNYYYATVRKNNTLSLRRLVNGTIHELDVGTMTVRAGQWYSVRMENIDNALRVYVDGVLRLEAKDATFETGRPGLMAYRTATSFDDVMMTEP